jgi:hypothetical protein
MRWNRGLLLGLLVAGSAGCLGGPAPGAGPSWLERFSSLRASLSPDAVQMQIALVRAPLGDRYLNEDLWREVDDQVVPPEQRPVLQANGFRVATVSGSTPAGLHELLTSARSLVGARWVAVPPGKELFIPLSSGDGPIAYTVVHDRESVAFGPERVQCGLAVEVRPGEHGQTVIRCEPRVQYGVNQLLPRPNEERTDWTLQPTRPEEKFPHLAWEVALDPNEYILVGGLPRQEQSLGYHCFVHVTPESAWQYVLVIRTAAAHPAGLAAARPVTHAARREALPLAVQSIRTPATARGNSP